MNDLIGNYFELLKTITVRLGDPRNFSTETLLPIQENLLTCCYEKNAEFVDWKKKSLQIDLLLNKPVLKAILHCLWRTANRIKIIAVIFQISNDCTGYTLQGQHDGKNLSMIGCTLILSVGLQV